jgi:uncharacterized protein
MALTTQIIGTTIGWLLIGWVVAQAALTAARAMRRRIENLRRYRAQKAEFCRQVEITARAARASKAIPEWDGWRPFRVAALADEARDVKSFYLTPVDGRALSRFAPGQYLTFRLQPQDSDVPVVRCYSLSASPREDFYRCTIKRIAAPPERPELPSGRGSSFFHEHVRVGDVLEARAPAGTFLIDPQSGAPIVLIGAGIGITPLVSMLDAIVLAGRQREVHVLFGFRNGEEHPFKEHLQNLAKNHAHVRLHVSYSEPLATDVLYRDYNQRGRMTIRRVREVLPSNNYVFYLCGPGQMMEELVPALWTWGVPKADVHFEAFGPASVQRVGAAATDCGSLEPCEVRFSRSDRSATWDGAFASLLEFGEAAGVVMPSGCRAGSCGECMLPLERGSVQSLKPPSITVPDGHCLTCISVPAGELVLDA